MTQMQMSISKDYAALFGGLFTWSIATAIIAFVLTRFLAHAPTWLPENIRNSRIESLFQWSLPSRLLGAGCLLSFLLPISEKQIHNFEQFVLIILSIELSLKLSGLVEATMESQIARIRKRERSEFQSIGIIRWLGRLFTLSLAALFILPRFGVNIGALVAGLGVGGIALALALQQILGDAFASLAITFDEPFRIGDTIRWMSHRGTIRSVGVKTTRIEISPTETLVVPNSLLVQKEIINERFPVHSSIKIQAKWEHPSGELIEWDKIQRHWSEESAHLGPCFFRFLSISKTQTLVETIWKQNTSVNTSTSDNLKIEQLVARWIGREPKLTEITFIEH